MSAQHKRPLLAFLLVVVLCIILLGQAVRSEALLGLLVSADREPFGPEQIRLSAEVRDRVVTDAPRVRSPRAPAGASVTPDRQPAAKPTPARRVARHLGSVDGGGLLAHRPTRHGPKATPTGHAQREAGHPGKHLGKPAGWIPPGQAKKATQGKAHGHVRKSQRRAKVSRRNQPGRAEPTRARTLVSNLASNPPDGVETALARLLNQRAGLGASSASTRSASSESSTVKLSVAGDLAGLAQVVGGGLGGPDRSGGAGDRRRATARRASRPWPRTWRRGCRSARQRRRPARPGRRRAPAGPRRSATTRGAPSRPATTTRPPRSRRARNGASRRSSVCSAQARVALAESGAGAVGVRPLLDQLEVVVAELPEELLGDLERGGVVVGVEGRGRAAAHLAEPAGAGRGRPARWRAAGRGRWPRRCRARTSRR